MRSPADVYEKIVYWSEEDQVFIGMCPELFYGGVHGDDSVEVFKELCEAADEWVEIFKDPHEIINQRMLVQYQSSHLIYTPFRRQTWICCIPTSCT